MKIAIKVIIVLFLVVCTYLIFKEFDGVRFKTESYEREIESLTVQIDSLHGHNDSLETTIQVVEKENSVLEKKASELKENIKALKEKNTKIIAANAYRPKQVDSFFVDRYKDQYAVKTKDTTHLPIPVSKAVVVDLLDLDRTKTIVLNQDSLITNLESTVNGKDKVIVTLRTKEGNYESIIQKQVQQQNNYKIIVEGLKGDIRKLDRKNKLNKLTKFGMGVLI